MPDCSAEFEDISHLQASRPTSMSKNFSYDYPQDELFEGSLIPADLIDLEDLIDFDEDDHIDTLLQNHRSRYSEDLTHDDTDLNMLPTSNCDPTSEQIIQSASLDHNASSLEKALTDAVGDALSSCFEDEYSTDEMFIENLLNSSEEIPLANDQVEIASTSSMILSKCTLPHRITSTPQTSRVIRDTSGNDTPKVFTTLNSTSDKLNNNGVTLTSKKRTYSFPSLEVPSPKRYTTQKCVDRENENDLPDQPCQQMPFAKDIRTENDKVRLYSSIRLDSYLINTIHILQKCSTHLSKSKPRDTTVNSDISALKKQIAEWKQAARTAFEAARKIRAQMELEKFRADQAEKIITQLTSRIRSKAARRRYEKITKMHRSQSLTQDAASSTKVTLAGSSNDRSITSAVFEDKNSDCKKDNAIVKPFRKSTGCKSSQINDQVRLALRAKVRSVNASTLQTAKDIVQETEVLLKDLPVTTGLKNIDE